jgi:uracil-DNA glycosylase family 4
MQKKPWQDYEVCRKCFSPQDERAITYPRRSLEARDIMFVGQAPSFAKNLSKRRPVLDCSEGSNAAKLLCEILRQLSYDPSGFYFTNLAKCSSLTQHKEGYPDRCFQFLQQEINEVKPKRIIALGRKVESFLKKKELPQLRFSYHPAYLLRHCITRQEYSQQLQSAIKLAH